MSTFSYSLKGVGFKTLMRNHFTTWRLQCSSCRGSVSVVSIQRSSPRLQLSTLLLNSSSTLIGSPPVRRGSSDVVSVVAKHAVPAGEWPELLPFLHQCSQSAQEDHREVSAVTLIVLS